MNCFFRSLFLTHCSSFFLKLHYKDPIYIFIFPSDLLICWLWHYLVFPDGLYLSYKYLGDYSFLPVVDNSEKHFFSTLSYWHKPMIIGSTGFKPRHEIEMGTFSCLGQFEEQGSLKTSLENIISGSSLY